MSEPTLIQSKTSLPVDQIEVSHRLRPVSAAGVETIVASVREIGHIANPVVVRQLRREGETLYRVLDGAHRLAAATALGWTEVPVRVFECTDDQARIMEIDGNLSGAELNPLDTAVFLATRKAVYERLHPETKAGAAGALARWSDATDSMSVAFVTATAEKFTLSERHVRRLVAAGSRLGPDEIAKLRTAPKKVTLKDLQVIAKINSAAERYDVVDLLAWGEAKSAADARKVRATRQPDYAGPRYVSPVDQAWMDLAKRFRSAPMEARRRFVQELWPELTRVMRDAAPVAADGEGGDE